MSRELLFCQRKQTHVNERGLLDGALSRAERRALVRHLLKGCPECTAFARWIWHMAERAEKGSPEC